MSAHPGTVREQPGHSRPGSRATTGEETVYRLNGHSGAEVVLVRCGDVHFVRKTAGSVEQNERLLEQAASQRRFFFSGLPFPRVLCDGVDDRGLAYFEMEYVAGQTVANMVCEAMPFDTAAVVGALERLFDLLRMTAGCALPSEAFLAKISQIEACRAEACLPHVDALKAVAQRLRSFCWDGIPQSTGHGDLTLENLLSVQQRDVVFIDCDRCFASSWWLDAAKLYQDIAGHWCLRRFHLSDEGGPGLGNAMAQMDRLALPMRAMIVRLDPALVLRLPQLIALHLFRTLPYAKDKRVVGFVLARMAMVLEKT